MAPHPPQAPRPAAPAQPPALQTPTPPAAQAVRTAPEDILDAARSRVLPQIPAPPVAAAPAQPAAAAARPRPPGTEVGKRDEGRDFERLLDAQISGDLGRLATEPAPRAPSIDAPRPAPRNEPTLEEEMNRMLSEMGNERKP